MFVMKALCVGLGSLVFLAFLLPAGEIARAEGEKAGKVLYTTCVVCHGQYGEGSQSLGTPRIAGQHAWYLAHQLANFKKGRRGYDPKDTYGSQMRKIAETLRDDTAIEGVIGYIAKLKAPLPPSTFEAGLRRGRRLYKTCKMCHGKKALGKKGLMTPKLNEQHDWYMLRQLMNYRSDMRGTHPEDNRGGRMWGIAKTIEDDEALRDIVAFITSLR